ncbi:hypothetical protein B0A48_10062 [Cryoendolithus antarcticus]|uniref:Proteasome assembly chaperone 3 n=1 Tax=Cryoendolithus antarcticus TaxID=1507870 RepID=A0A1V8T3I0_9PEZI|nr:hypothetical protein B0A48_10062 [Cryoendolithus antarcticus]
MAAGAHLTSTTNGTHPAASAKPLQLAITLPSNPQTRVHLHLTLTPTTLLLHSTTTSPETPSSSAALGSFVYALPDRYNPSQPLSTPLYTIPSTVDFTTRLAKVLVRKTAKACYVSWSGDLTGGVMGGSVEEEMEVFRGIVEVVMAEVGKGAAS